MLRLSFRRLRLFSVFTFIALTLTFLPLHLALAQSSPPTHKPPAPPPPPPAVDQQQFISYWTTETGWRTALQLRNNQVGRVLTVTPVLRTADGTETPLFPVVIQPQEVKTVDVETAIGNSAPQLIGAYGSLALRYRAPSQINLYAVAMVMGVGHSIAFHIDGTGEDQTEDLGSREGIWWLPNSSASDYLVLTNHGQNPIQANLTVSDASGKTSSQNIALAPRSAKRYSIRQIVTAGKLAGSYGGIKVSAGKHAGALDTLHVLFDENGGFSAVMKMFDYDPRAQLKERDYAGTGVWTLRAPMLALSNPDPALAFPEGTTLQPQLFIRNVTSKPVDATLAFNWRTDTTTGAAPSSVLRLSPNETRRIDVAALQDGKTLPQNAQWASVILTTNSLPDEVMAVAASFDKTLKFGAQTPFSDQLSAHWVGGQWEYDPQHDSIITAGNGGTKPTQAAFTIFYNQGAQKYELDQTLQPGEQMWMDVGKLIRESIPDKDGNTLPSDLTSGSYQIRDLTNKINGTLFEGKVIYDKTYGHVVYGCAACCGWTTPVTLWYDPIAVIITGLQDDGVFAWYPCGNYTDDVSQSFYGGWSSGAPSIVTVDTYGTHNGVGVGSTTTQTFASIPSNNAHLRCPTHGYTPSGGANVNPVVTIGSFSQNPVLQGSTATVQVTVNPSATITLTISSTGSGAAKFDNQSGGTSKTISGTTTVTIYGVTASSASLDLTLSASYGGSVVQSAGFTVTSGACTLGSENDTGSGTKVCPSSVTLQASFTVSQYCATCTYSCVIHPDSAWVPGGCSATAAHVDGSLSGTETTAATGTFSTTDCNWHYTNFTTTVTDANNNRTNVTSGNIGLKCTANGNGVPCP
jgi:hypothetical protein